MNYLLEIDEWKKFEKNNPIVALDAAYVKNEYISYLHFKIQLKSWKINSFLNDSRQRRIALPFCRKLSALLRDIMSKHDADFYCFDSLHLFTTKHKLE